MQLLLILRIFDVSVSVITLGSGDQVIYCFPNLSFRMLFAFIQQQQQEKAVSLCIIYTVGGFMKDNNGNLVWLEL